MAVLAAAGSGPALVEDWLVHNRDRLIAVRRDLHAHPELGRQETRTTHRLRQALEAAGLAPRSLPGGTGLICDIGDRPRLALRADLDALPLEDLKPVPYRSTVPGVAHACGHDVHTTIVLGAALVCARLLAAGLLPAPVRVIFQPAEELMPGGAHDVIAAGGLDGIRQILAVHADPTLPAGTVGLAEGAITAASDGVEVRVSGPGGHTARPHRSADLVGALAAVVAQAPAVLARRVDPRSVTTLVWGQIAAGSAANVIPQEGFARGTLRTLDLQAWETAPGLLSRIVGELAAAWGVTAQTRHQRGVPPVVNTADGVSLLRRGLALLLPSDAETTTSPSMGGEDFGWYLRQTSGAMARLGASPPAGAPVDLHQPGFDVDEGCLEVGVRLLVGAALAFD